jgi:diadenosine tetraphosphate (Ap4A) HIT family hydrolase
MRRLEAAGRCIFCPRTSEDPADPDLLRRLGNWAVRRNAYPYRGTRHHLLLAPTEHVRDLLDLSAATQHGFWDALRWVRDEFDLQFYGLGARCGDCALTGGTIEHVHVHVVVGEVDDPAHEPVRLKLSTRRVD